MTRIVILLLVATLLFGQSEPLGRAKAGPEERGRVIRKTLEHGDYASYLPKSEPQDVLVIVHGTLGKGEAALDVAERFIKRWIDVAERRRLLLLAPAFDQENFGGHAGPGGGYRGLFGRRIGADEFLNTIVDAARQQYPTLPSKFFLYGHSAGGQFVSRYVVKHPDRIKAAVISAAGTFAFPDPNVPWTNGMGRLQRRMRWSDDETWQPIDINPDPEGWLKAARLPIAVVIGAQDVGKIEPLPGNPGRTHVERGRLWVQAMNELARQHGHVGKARFVVVAGVGHDSARLTPRCKKAFWAE